MGTSSRSSKFQQYVKSELLGEEKIITALTKAELQIKVERQLRLWEEQEEHLIGAQMAENKTQEAQALQSALRELLKREVRKGTKPGWKGRGNTPSFYPPFVFREAPTYEASARLFILPQGNRFMELFSPGLKKERERAEALARGHYQQALRHCHNALARI